MPRNVGQPAVIRALLLATMIAIGAMATAANAAPTGRVINGTDAANAPDPLVHGAVFLASRGAGPLLDRLFCTGVLVAPTWVLTARHCVQDPDSGQVSEASTMLVGRGTGSGVALGATNDVVGVRAIYRSSGPVGTMDARVADMALLQLTAPLRTGVMAQLATPADAAWWGNGAGRPTGVFFTGWGVRSNAQDAAMSSTLQFIELPVVSARTCADSSNEPSLSAQFICADVISTDPSAARSACFGDSGGPLFATDPSTTPDTVDATDAFKVVGITSFSIDGVCGTSYDHFTPVVRHPWLARYIATAAGDNAGLPAPTVRIESRRSTLVRLAFIGARVGAKGRIVLVRAPGARTWTELGRTGVAKATMRLPTNHTGRVQLQVRTVDAAGIEGVGRTITVPTG
jgi:secreted trypsin-like serine protease